MKKRITEIVDKMIDRFGTNRQIVVAMEELCELSSAVAKYVRYDDKGRAILETREKVLDEYCDVLIVLETIAEVYGFDDENIRPHLEAKLDRAVRWVESKEGMEVTTTDRAVVEKTNL